MLTRHETKAARALVRAIVNDYCGSDAVWVRRWAERNGVRCPGNAYFNVRKIVAEAKRRIENFDMTDGGRWAADIKLNDRTGPVAADAARRRAGKM